MWEGFFADAYGTGEAAYWTVKGMQDAGTITTAKHYVGYEQETFRYGYGTVSYLACLHEVECRNPYNQIEGYSVFPVNAQSPISSNVEDKATHEVGLFASEL